MAESTSLMHGQFYHVFNRGNNGEDLFLEVRNYQHFLNLYAKHIYPIAETYAYCLLKNHFHILVRIKTPEEIEETLKVSETLRVFTSPSQQFSNLFNAYTKAINKAYQRTGSLFEHPFHRIEIANEGHFLRLITYIHRNPQKHGFVEDFRKWPHTSYRAFVSQQPTRIARDIVLELFGGMKGFVEAHQYEDESDLISSLVLE